MIPLAHLKDRRMSVLGLGKSGIATARAAKAGGVAVSAWDDSAERRAALTDIPMQDPSTLDWQPGDVLVPAPGIPLTHPAPHPAIAAALEAGAKVVGDVDLYATAHPDVVRVGITGTNGKSTTTALIAHILNACGKSAVAAGNIGTAVLDLDPPKRGTIDVLELSSYQLDLIHDLKPRVGVFLNLTPDHLDRHGDMDGYMAAKARLFANMGDGDIAVVCIDDDAGRTLANTLDQRGLTVVRVATDERRATGVSVANGILFEDSAEIADLNKSPALPGLHNHQNAAAAFAVCRALGCEADAIVAGLNSFPGLAHRIERIGQIGDITFFNDSKATNAEAAARALSAFDGIYWIAGGVPKQGGLGPLVPCLSNVRRAYLIGEAMAAFEAELSGKIETRRCETLAAATEAAWDDARAAGSGTVLLSPACASFDQFPNFEARGDAFRAAADFIIAREGGRS